jgi:hypothetical protein
LGKLKTRSNASTANAQAHSRQLKKQASKARLALQVAGIASLSSYDSTKSMSGNTVAVATNAQPAGAFDLPVCAASLVPCTTSDASN